MKKEYDSVIKSYHKKGNSFIKIEAFCLAFVSIVMAICMNQDKFFKKEIKLVEVVDNDESGEVGETPEDLLTIFPETTEEELQEEKQPENEETKTDGEQIIEETEAEPTIVPEEILTNTTKKFAIVNVEVKAKAANNAAVLGIIKEGEEVLLLEEGTSWDTIMYQDQIAYLKKDFLTDKKLQNRNIEVDFTDRGIDPTKPMVALTFDDGPNPISTTQILDTLEKYHVVATFFDLGKLVSCYPEVVKREEALGCEVGSHSYEHKNLIKISEEELKEDVRKSEEAFMNALGHKPNLYRPPYGNISITVKETLDYPLIIWNVDSLDWKLRNKDKILAQIRKTENLDGCIILMHSIYTSTADTVEELVPELLEKGYQFVTVPELAHYKQGWQLRTREVYGRFNY